jgi:hypothetical protein
MSSEKLNSQEDNAPLIIEINRNIGTSTDPNAVVMPKNVSTEKKPIENLPEEKTDNQSI